ncbi:MAG: hemerythrin domain-containing protein [bacterium]
MTLKKSDIAAQVEKEHECIKRDMGLIQKEITQDVPAEEFAEWRLEFMWRLRDFRLHLLKHFDLEEAGGFMKEILNEAPQSMNSVKKLEAEHEEIVAELDEILTTLKQMELKDDAKMAEVRTRVLNFLTAIRKHEAAENELIAMVYCQEYGYPS